MNITSVKTYFKGLENHTQKTLLEEFTMISDRSEFNLLSIRGEQLNNKQDGCPPCNSIEIYKRRTGKKWGTKISLQILQSQLQFFFRDMACQDK